MMLYRFEVDYTVPGKMGSKNYVTAVAATDAAHARVEAGKIFEGLKERLNGDLKDVDTISANIYRASGGKDGDRAIVGVSRLGVNLFRLI